MKVNSVEVNWGSNGRVLPTESERERMRGTIISVAFYLSPMFFDGQELETSVYFEIENNALKYGWNTLDAKRILADCVIGVR